MNRTFFLYAMLTSTLLIGCTQKPKPDSEITHNNGQQATENTAADPDNNETKAQNEIANADEDGVFKFTVDCNKKSVDIHISVYDDDNNYPVNYDLDCDGDGKYEHTALDRNITCVVECKSDKHQIRMRGDIPAIKLCGGANTYSIDNNWAVLSVDSWGNIEWKSMKEFAAGCTKLIQLPIQAPNLSKVTDMSSMFRRAESFNQPLEMWDVSHITNMSWMFFDAYAFNQPLEKWNVANVTNMNNMFSSASSFNQPLGKWNVANVTNMNSMFSSASSFNQPLEMWDVSHVTDMTRMFANAYAFNQPLEKWNVANVTDMQSMFSSATSFNQPLEMWDVSHVTNMSEMFSCADSFNQPLEKWNVANVTDMESMFEQAKVFNQPLGKWDVSNVTNMKSMFIDAESFNQPLENWNVSNVTNMNAMFSHAISFNQPLGKWNVSKVVDMSKMFFEANAFRQTLKEWDISSLLEMDNMFNAGVENTLIIPKEITSEKELLNSKNVLDIAKYEYGLLRAVGCTFDQMKEVYFVGEEKNLTPAILNSGIPYYEHESRNTYHCEHEKADRSLLKKLIKKDGKTIINRLLFKYLYEGYDCFGGGSGDSEFFYILLDLGADITQPNEKGTTILMLTDSDDIAKKFIKAGGDVNAKNDKGLTAFQMQNDKLDRMNVICSGSDDEECEEYFYQEGTMGDDDDGKTCADYVRDRIREIISMIERDSRFIYPNLDLSVNFEDRQPFIFSITTDIETGSEDVAIPIIAEASDKKSPAKYDLDCDGDGKYEYIGLRMKATCRYKPNSGKHQIRVRGDISAITLCGYNTDSNEAVISVDSWGDIQWKSMNYFASDCKNLNKLPDEAPNLSQVTDMSGMFIDAESFNQPLEGWDVSNVTNMADMFRGAKTFNQPLEKWNVSNVTDMAGMFSGAKSFNQPLGKWNVSKVTNMRFMFGVDYFLDEEDTVSFNQPLEQWDVSNVTDMEAMFHGAVFFNQPLNKWNVSKVNNMRNMFSDAKSFNQPLEQWDVSNVTDMAGMFRGAKTFNQPLEKWNVSKVRQMSWMFNDAESFNQPLNNWDVSKVFEMDYMFSGAKSFNQPLNNWDVSKVKNMKHILDGAESFNQPLENWNISR